MSSQIKNQPHRFQVNLGGIIDLLANHLYSSPRVYIRELLQNCVDAITARKASEPEYEGTINIEIVEHNDIIALCVEDNGIGLTEEEIHTFLSTIGSSSKQESVTEQRQTYIGQFGIGLLSCFMVSDEILVVTRSAKPDSSTIEWCGKADGTYSLRHPDEEAEIGTRVYLQAKSEHKELFSPETLFRLIGFFGGLLPFPIFLRYQSEKVRVNTSPPPWRRQWKAKAAEQRALIAYGKEVFKEDFFDAIPLVSEIGKVRGIAYVLPYSGTIGTRQKHRVYLKNMLVSETAEEILPDWAFFIRCIINTDDLNPTASREGFYEDEKLETVRNILGQALQDYLTVLAENEPERLQRLIKLHFRALKAMASENPELLKIFGKWLPFETSFGEMIFDDIQKHSAHIRYVPQVDRFRQIAPIAASQRIVVINAGYSYDSEIIELLAEIFNHIEIEVLEAEHIFHEFENLTFDERDRVFPFIMEAEKALMEFGIQVELRRFNPIEIPALYLPDATQEFLRSAERTIEEANPFFGSVLQNATYDMRENSGKTVLCMNYQNRLIQRLTESPEDQVGKIVRLLYAQALLLGHYPLNHAEMNILTKGLLDILETCLESVI